MQINTGEVMNTSFIEVATDSLHIHREQIRQQFVLRVEDDYQTIGKLSALTESSGAFTK